MARSLFKKAARSITAVGKAARADTMGDFTATAGVLDSIYGNLTTAGAGAGAALTAAQDRQLAAIQRITSKGSARSKAIQKGAQAGIVKRYGSAMGPSGATTLGVARATGSATRVEAKAAQRGAQTLAEGGQEALQVAQTGADQARAAADYALAVSLKSRFKDDATQVAEMRQELAMTKLNAQLALKAARVQASLDWKYKEMEIDKMQEIEEDDPVTTAGITMAAGAAANAFPQIQQMLWQKNEEGGYKYTSAKAASDAYIASQGIQDPNEIAFVQHIVNAMWSAGAGPGTEGQMSTDPAVRAQMVEDSIMETFLSLYPQWKGHADEIRGYLNASGNASYSGWTTGYVAGAAEGAGTSEAENDAGYTPSEWDDASTLEKAGSHFSSHFVESIRQALADRGYSAKEIEQALRENGLA